MGTSSALTVPQVLARRLAGDPGRPFITFYDDATGERVELSVATFDNWVSKVVNLYVDEFMLDAGDEVSVDLPVHWQAAVVMVAAWCAGLTVTFSAGDDTACCVVGPAALEQPPAGSSGEVLACSLRPLGGPFSRPLPGGWRDFAVEVPPQPDVVVTPAEVLPETPALVHPAGVWTHEEILRHAAETADREGWSTGTRLLSDLNPASLVGVEAALLAPLGADGSLVLVAHPDSGSLESRGVQERVTHVHTE